jgi:hypothetical protein
MAAQTVSGSMNVQLSLSEILPHGLSNSTATGQILPSYTLINGNTNTALGINQIFCKGSTAVTLNSNSSVTYTLTSLTDDLGRAVSFANGVRGLAIYVTSRSTGDYLSVGNAASNAWTGIVSTGTATMKVYDFAAFQVASTDKYTATNGSNEQIKILNSGTNAITFKIAVWGNN